MSGEKIETPGLIRLLSEVITLGTSDGISCLDADSLNEERKAVSHLMIKQRDLFKRCKNSIDPIPMVYLVQGDRARAHELQNFCAALNANTTKLTPANIKRSRVGSNMIKLATTGKEHLLFQ